MVKDLTRDLQVFCRIVADNTKCLGRSDDVPSIELTFDRTVEWIDRNCIIPNAAKSQHLLYNRKTCPFFAPMAFPLQFPGYIVQSIKNSRCKTAQIDAAGFKSRDMLSFIKRTLNRCTSHHISSCTYISLYCLPAWAFRLICDITKQDYLQEVAFR